MAWISSRLMLSCFHILHGDDDAYWQAEVVVARRNRDDGVRIEGRPCLRQLSLVAGSSHVCYDGDAEVHWLVCELQSSSTLMELLELADESSGTIFVFRLEVDDEIFAAFCAEGYSDPVRFVSITTGVSDLSVHLCLDEALDDDARVDVRCEVAQD